MLYILSPTQYQQTSFPYSLTNGFWKCIELWLWRSPKEVASGRNLRHLWQVGPPPQKSSKWSPPEAQWECFRRLGAVIHRCFGLWVCPWVNVACTLGGEEEGLQVRAAIQSHLVNTAFECAHGAFSHRHWELSSPVSHDEGQLYFICIFVIKHGHRSFLLSEFLVFLITASFQLC